MKKNILGAIALLGLFSFTTTANSEVQNENRIAVSEIEAVQDPEEMDVVEQMVAQTNEQLPVAIAEGLNLVEMGVAKGYVVYVFQVTDAIFQGVAALGVEGNVAAGLADAEAKGLNDPLTAAMVELGYGLTSCYINAETEDQFVFSITAEDLATAALKNYEEE